MQFAGGVAIGRNALWLQGVKTLSGKIDDLRSMNRGRATLAMAGARPQSAS